NTRTFWALIFAGGDIGPQGLDLRRGDAAAPGGHEVLAVGDRGDEAIVLVARELPQIEGAKIGVRVLHALAVAAGAIARKDRRAGGNLLGREVLRVLRLRIARPG